MEQPPRSSATWARSCAAKAWHNGCMTFSPHERQETPMPTTHELVEDFYRKFELEQFLPEGKPSLEHLTPERLDMKVGLIAEEFGELLEAVYGPEAKLLVKAAWSAVLERFLDDRSLDIVETADALADLDYVINNLAHEAAIPHDKVVREVHRSNLTKLDEDGKPIVSDGTFRNARGEVQPVGKIVKSELYENPRIAEVLEEVHDNS